MAVVIFLKEFTFEFGQVNIGGTLGFATLAGKAKIKDAEKSIAGDGLGAQLASHSQPKGVGTGASRMLLVEGNSKARAHSPGKASSASTVAIAHFNSGGKTAVLAVMILAGHNGSFVVGPVAKIDIHGIWVNDDAGVHEAGGVKKSLHLP